MKSKFVPYIDKDELATLVAQFQKKTLHLKQYTLKHLDPRLAQLLRDIAWKLVHSKQFIGYAEDLREDMLSLAFEHQCKYGLKNCDPQKNCFGYLLRTAFNAFIQVLKKHYTDLNRKRELYRKAVEELQLEFPNQFDAIKRHLNERDWYNLTDDEAKRVEQAMKGNNRES